MKKIIFIFILTIAPLFAMSQSNISMHSVESDLILENPAPKTTSKVKTKTNLSLEVKREVLKMNHKKSNELISIKAFRKSLQIKTKNIKTC